MTREEINELNVVEPYCVETDREEQWFNVGLKAGLNVGEKYMIEKACEWLLDNTGKYMVVTGGGYWFKDIEFIKDFKRYLEE